jgi:2-keto-4-pentenoate hydratase/2-oxohepta-3-ene-1,7-dioic acid hydratase in catechol pathway
MPLWAPVIHEGRECFGTVDGETMLHEGECSRIRGRRRVDPLNAARPLTPTSPKGHGKLVDNYRALVAKLNHAVPAEPLYFSRPTTRFWLAAIRFAPSPPPARWSGEGERPALSSANAAVWLCRQMRQASSSDTPASTTSPPSTFPTRIRALRSGPRQGLRHLRAFVRDRDRCRPAKLIVKTILNGQERQNYPLSDIIFAPEELVSLISHDMTLEAGDVIACGTSVGVGSMKPGSTVSIIIEGIGTLTNRFDS